MLEIDSRALLATIKQLRSANEESKKKLEEALREKEAMAQDVEMREKIVAQREKAVKVRDNGWSAFSRHFYTAQAGRGL